MGGTLGACTDGEADEGEWSGLRLGDARVLLLPLLLSASMLCGLLLAALHLAWVAAYDCGRGREDKARRAVRAGALRAPRRVGIPLGWAVPVVGALRHRVGVGCEGRVGRVGRVVWAVSAVGVVVAQESMREGVCWDLGRVDGNGLVCCVWILGRRE